MEIREINEKDDLKEISQVYEESWKYAYQGIIPQDYLDSISKGKWCDALLKDQRHSMIMIDHHQIVGTSSYGPSRYKNMKKYGEIISIYLLTKYCGKGYGYDLLQATINGLKHMGYSQIFLWVLEDNNVARHFYEKNGFHKNNLAIKQNIGGKILKEICYILEIEGEK